MGERRWGACSAAAAVMAAAFGAEVWSFQSQACAAGSSLHASDMARGRAFASTGRGVEPVVSTPMPMTRSREKPSADSARARAARVASRRPST